MLNLETKNQNENQEKSWEIYRKEKGKSNRARGRDRCSIEFIVCNCWTTAPTEMGCATIISHASFIDPTTFAPTIDEEVQSCQNTWHEQRKSWQIREKIRLNLQALWVWVL